MKLQHRAAIILFLEGLASAGLQMIAIRQSVPFVGSSVLSTSIVISVFLAALALGYYWGGQQKTNKYRKKLVTNIMASLVLFGIGLSYIFVSTFYLSVADLTTGIPYLENPLSHLFMFCLLVMAPLVFFLAQTVPLLLNTAAESTSKSEATGNATALSTVGNVLGCLLTSLVCMYFFGVGASIFLNCTVLALCLVFLLDWKRTSSYGAAGFALSCLVITFFINVKVSDQIFEATTPYSNIQVSDTEDGKRLIINHSNASFISKDGTRAWEYIEMMKDAIFADDMTGKDILVLGSGGFTLSAEDTHGANFYYLDIDPKLKTVAESKFLESPIKGDFIVQDARAFLLTSEKKWDVIVIDLYSNGSTIPMHTSTLEFFQLVGSRLNPNTGKAVLNIVANPRMNDRFSVTMDNTIRTALSRCITDITSYDNALANIVYFCSPSTKDIDSKGQFVVAGLYKDDKTDVAVDSYVSAISAVKWEK